MTRTRRVTKKSLAQDANMPPEPPSRGVISSQSNNGFALTGDRRDVRVVCTVCDRKEVFAKKDKAGADTFQRNHRVVCKIAAP